MLTRYFAWLTRHPLGVLAAGLLVTGALGVGAARVEIFVDIDANLPAGHPYVEADREIQREFGGRNIVAIAFRVEGDGIWNPGGLRLLGELTREVARLPGVVEANVFSLAAPKVKDVRGTAAISVGYGSIAVSSFYLNQVLSRLVPLTMAVSCLVGLTLLPAAFLHFRPRFLFGPLPVSRLTPTRLAAGIGPPSRIP